jgi:uncharacterized protein YkwD
LLQPHHNVKQINAALVLSVSSDSAGRLEKRYSDLQTQCFENQDRSRTLMETGGRNEFALGAKNAHISKSRYGAPGRVLIRAVAAVLSILFCAVAARAQGEEERKLVDLTNEARSEAGLQPLRWDAALAAAAHAHAVLMASEGPISHRYGGEQDLPERAAKAGAHFSLIEENIAVGPSPAQIHNGWMHSLAHHDNLLNAQINRVGVALVSAKGVLYAVADYAQGVQSQTTEQVEANVGKVIQGRGLTLLSDGGGARYYCAQEGNSAGGTGGAKKARFLMRWQSAEITKLPPQLEEAIRSGQFKQASVGACDTKGSGSGGPTFSGYRVAVLLY